MTERKNAISSGLSALGIGEQDTLAERLSSYLEELQRWNKAYNLTAVRDPDQMVVTHVLDSLSVLPYVKGPVLDVGSGAGLPGLLLAMADPDLAVTSVESVGKKARFQRHICRSFGLDRVSVVEDRVEHFQSEGGFATVTCRAFTSLDRFIDLTRHLIAPGGRWVAMKGQVPDEELKALDTSVIVETTTPLSVPGLDAERCLVVLREAV